MPEPATAHALFLNTILSTALEKKATDIYLISGNYPILRLESKLYIMNEEKLITVDVVMALVDTLLSPAEQQRLQAEKDVRTMYAWANRARFRVAVFYQQGYPAISLHLIPNEIPTTEILGLPAKLVSLATQQQGLVIICGPFNSGKSATMASLVQHINTNFSKRIVMLERPVENIIQNSLSIVNQREVGRDTPSFARGIGDALEDDVDVVVLSELNEPGIHEEVLKLVESGKMVIALMNSISSISALENFVESVPKDRRQWAKDTLAILLKGIINQRLVPAIGGGRILAAEFLHVTPAVATIIQEERFSQLANVLLTSRGEGMVSLDYRLSELVKLGKISAEEARKYAIDPTIIRT